MKRTLLFTFFGLLFSSATVFGQDFNPLYIGYSTNNTISVVDTSGGTYTIASSLTLTNDIATTINGTFGLAVNPLNQQMYILYQDGGGNLSRRLGILDTASGFITDIGVSGNMTDIAFRDDGTMYATSGDPVGRALYSCNPADASTALLSAYSLVPTYGNGFGYDPYGDRLIYTSQIPGYFAEIDLTTYADVNFGFSGHPGWLNSVEMLNPDMFIAIGGSGFYEVTISTLTYANVPFAAAGTMHAASFGPQGLSVIVNGPTTFCANESSFLAASDTATTYQWLLDGSPVAGATDSLYTPIASGDYSWVQNGVDTSADVTIVVLPIPTAGFTASPNPLDLGFVPSGNIDFTNTSTGSDNEYHWDFDNGFTTTLTDPSMSFPTTGTYDVELVAIDTVNGCSDTVVVTITVTNSTGISELTAEINIYPIPADDVINVQMTSGAGLYQLELVDLGGQLIESTQISADNKNVEMSLKNLDAGVYLMKVYNDGEQGIFKVVKR